MSTVRSDLVIYDEQFHAGATEVVDQAIDKFNANSAGTIIMSSESLMGDFDSETMLQLISGMATDRDPNSNAAVADTIAVNFEHTKVKVDGKIKPIAFNKSAFRRLGKTAEEISLNLGRQAGAAQLQYQFNTALYSLVASSQAANLAGATTMTAAGDATVGDLNSANSLFGDRSDAISAYVMHSKVWHDLVGDQVVPATSIFGVGNTTVREGTTPTLGRPVIVTDSPALINGGNYTTLGLTANAAQVVNSETYDAMLEQVSGFENIKVRFQAEFAFNVGVKGMTYDKASGASPTQAQIALPARWSRAVTQDKDTFGVALIST